ncbi:MAG TPA: amidohydrolase family protein [Thermoanaerobaculia bacterium]
MRSELFPAVRYELASTSRLRRRELRCLSLFSIALLATLLLGCASAHQPPLLAIQNVTIIDPDGEETAPATLLIRGGVIERYGPPAGFVVPARARIVEASGLFMIPGLWDMHVHAHRGNRQTFHVPLYLAHGVTTVREAGTHLGSALAARQQPEGDLLPRVIWGSPPIDGAPPVLTFGLAAETPEAGRALVRRLAAERFDFLKVYDLLSPETHAAVLAEAHRLGIPVDGHVPLRSSPAEALERGQRTIEHLTLVLESCIPGTLDWIHETPGRDSMALLTDGRLAATLDRYDEEICKALFARFVAAGTWHIPTLVQMRGAFFIDDPTVTAHPGHAMVPEAVRDEWEEYRRNAAPIEMAAGRAVFDRQLQLVGAMHRAGVRILAGTDASTEPHVVPGWSLHDELALFVQAGLTPLEALRTATTDAARHSRPGEPAGIRPGARADFVLLRADPRIEIANTRTIEHVILRGRLITREELDQLVAEAQGGTHSRQ